MLTERILADDYKMFTMLEPDLQIVDKEKTRKNVIQLVFNELTILWDLDRNKEVTFVHGQTQFNTADTFVRTGVKVNVHP